MRSDSERLKETLLDGPALFRDLVRALAEGGIASDAFRHSACDLPAWMISAFTQEDFDALYRHFYPGQGHDIQLLKLAIDVGNKGAFTYGLFNTNILNLAAAKKWLERVNQMENAGQPGPAWK